MNTQVDAPKETIVIKRKIVKSKLSIRRKKGLFHLRGDDPEFHNYKIGSSFAPNSKSHLSGLSFEEEELLLPSILGTDPKDIKWRNTVQNYWSSISVQVPSDGLGTDSLFGKVLEWEIEFSDSRLADRYDKASLTEKGFISSKALTSKNDDGTFKARILIGIEDYVLFRYCLVYGRVANSAKDAMKSNRIFFYLYSKNEETKAEHTLFELRKKAREKFYSILEDEGKLDGILRLFKISPEILESLEKKHIILEQKLVEFPKEFIDYVSDSHLAVKAFIFKAVDRGIIHNPAHTESYYYGDNKEVLIGSTLENAVLYCISKDEKKVEIVDTIKAQLKHNI